MRAASVAAAAVLTGLLAPAGTTLAAVPRTPERAATPGSYRAVEPVRVFDTQDPLDGASPQALPAGGSVAVTVVGRGAPAVATSAAAVLLRVTASGTSANGSVTVYPAGARRPGAANLYLAAGQRARNLAVVAVGAHGQVMVHNDAAGPADVRLDLIGSYAGGGPKVAERPGAFGVLRPGRVLDTRHGIGVRTSTPVAAHSTTTLRVEGRRGVPRGVTAVAVNLTAVDGTAGGQVRAYASGSTRPDTVALGYGRTAPAAGLAFVPTGDDGKIALANDSAGRVHLLADVVGYVAGGSPYVAGDFAAVPPARVLDGVPIGAGDSFTVPLGGRSGIPRANAAATLLTVTAARSTAGGDLDVGDAADPGVSTPATGDLSLSTDRAVTNLVVVRTSAGAATIRNDSAATVRVSADVTGYVAAVDLPVPPAMTGHYVRKLSNQPGGFTDQSATGVGCQDATSGDRFVLLDIGGQFRDGPDAAPYVKLSATDIDVSYGRLVAAVNSYVAGYVACDQTPHLILAVGTNNDGDLDHYGAARMGADWADLVVDAVHPVPGVTVRGANDIESGFVGDQYQALRWERAFLAATDKDLVFNGSADNCPSSYADPGGDCAYGWTQAQYRQLTHSGQASTRTPGADRIQALPQIYTPAQARQWTNIARQAGGAIQFAGSLTEHGAGPCDLCGMTASQGWTMLYRGLSTLAVSPDLPVAADLDIIG